MRDKYHIYLTAEERRAIKDLRNAGFVTTQQRYRKHGGKSSLLFMLN